MRLSFDRFKESLNYDNLCTRVGRVTGVTGQLIMGYLPGARVGSVCEVITKSGETCPVEVVGIRDGQVLLLPYMQISGIGFDSQIVLKRRDITCRVDENMLGRVINGLGEPIDDLGPLSGKHSISLYKDSINPLSREAVTQVLDVGVKSINSFVSVGKGQRMAIMAGSGVGKSTLMGMMARSTEADINVIALIGERGREVKEFVTDVLGEEGLKKSIVIAVTNDQSPLLRLRGAHLATAIAEYFSEQNKDVLLIMDSITRFAMAQREVGLNIGEAPTSRGYTPSLYPSLSRLLERAGNFEGKGSITGIYTVLVEGDDMDEPVADTVRSIVDGHIILDRSLAEQGQFPPVNVQQSISRVMGRIIEDEHKVASREVRRLLALYKESEDLINVGAYKQGSNPDIDRAISCFQDLRLFLSQSLDESISFDQTIAQLQSIHIRAGA